VFLLSIDEAMRYFKYNNDRVARYKGSDSWWWLRSPGNRADRAADVDGGGNVCADGSVVDYDTDGVRPALWLNL
jgi:hypothetical protein